MLRRHFVKTTAVCTTGIPLVTGSLSVEHLFKANNLDTEVTTVAGLNKFLRSLTEVKEPSVDRIIIGDQNLKIRKIGTCWLPDWNTLKKAVEKGVNIMVVHEPAFYTHWDLDNTTGDFYKAPEHAKNQYIALLEEKKKWILENNLAIIRCHDVLDKLGEIGIPFALGAALGLQESDILRSETFYNVYRVKPQKGAEMAGYVAKSLKQFNQPGVMFYGDENRVVSSIGVGTGCICDPIQFSHLEPDLFIAISDSVNTWIQTSFANDSGKPLVVIDHGTAEEAGMKLLSELLQKRLPWFETIHFNQGCSFKWIT